MKLSVRESSRGLTMSDVVPFGEFANEEDLEKDRLEYEFRKACLNTSIDGFDVEALIDSMIEEALEDD